MDIPWLLYFVLIIIPQWASSTKWLIDNPSFDDAQSWLSGYVPCSLETVVFPMLYSSVLPMPKEVDVSGFILPTEGALLLSQDSTITLGGGLNARSCESDQNRRAYIKKPNTKKWFDPHSWRSTEFISKSNKIPDMERVPCNNESVIIQRNGPLSIDLENVAYLRMGQLNLAGSLLSKDYLINFLNTDIGQILFQNSNDVSVEYYRNDVCGCHRDFAASIEPICQNIAKSCEQPHCLSPVLPYGNCCPICGSVLQFPIAQCGSTNINQLRRVISSAITQQNLNNVLEFYVSYINTAKSENYLQAIIIDSNKYNEISSSFVASLNASTDWNRILKGTQYFTIHSSGRPYNPHITFGSILLIILCLILVSIVGLVIFAHYAPNNRYTSYIPQWIYTMPTRLRALILRSSPLVFARFDNLHNTNEMRENIIMGYDNESEAGDRAFDNPMFSEPLSKPEERTESTTHTNEQELAKIDTDDQELTEINLEFVTNVNDNDNKTEM